MLPEGFLVETVDGGEVAEISEKNGALCDVAEGGSHCGLQCFDIREDLLRLGFDSAFHDLHRFWIQRNLA